MSSWETKSSDDILGDISRLADVIRNEPIPVAHREVILGPNMIMAIAKSNYDYIVSRARNCINQKQYLKLAGPLAIASERLKKAYKLKASLRESGDNFAAINLNTMEREKV